MKENCQFLSFSTVAQQNNNNQKHLWAVGTFSLDWKHTGHIGLQNWIFYNKLPLQYASNKKYKQVNYFQQDLYELVSTFFLCMK